MYSLITNFEKIINKRIYVICIVYIFEKTIFKKISFFNTILLKEDKTSSIIRKIALLD